MKYVGHKLGHFIGISPWRVSNLYDGDICHSARRSNHSVNEQGDNLYTVYQLHKSIHAKPYMYF